MKTERIKVTAKSAAYADFENKRLILEFTIPGAPTDTIDVEIFEDNIHLTAPAREIEYVAVLTLCRPVKLEIAEATYENGLLRIEVFFKDSMVDAVKVAGKVEGMETKTKSTETG